MSESLRARAAPQSPPQATTVLPYEPDGHSDPHLLQLQDDPMSPKLTDDSSSGLSSGSVDSVEPLERFRFVFHSLPWQLFNAVSIAVTLLLVIIAVMYPAFVMSKTFLALEFFMILLFVAELVGRFLLARNNFWRLKENVAEVVVAAVCIFFFILLVRHSGRSETLMMDPEQKKQHAARQEREHEVVVFLRVSAQLFRAVLYFRRNQQRHAGGVGLHHVPHGSVGGGGLV